MITLYLDSVKTGRSKNNTQQHYYQIVVFRIHRMGKSESQMDIMEKTTKPMKHRWTVVEIGLSVILLLMSCALAGLVVLYASTLRGETQTLACFMGYANVQSHSITCNKSLKRKKIQ